MSQLRLGEAPVRPQQQLPRWTGLWYWKVKLDRTGQLASYSSAQVEKEYPEKWQPVEWVSKGRVSWTGWQWRGMAANLEDAVDKAKLSLSKYDSKKPYNSTPPETTKRA